MRRFGFKGSCVMTKCSLLPPAIQSAFAPVAENATLPVLVTGPSAGGHAILFCNKSFVGLTGYSPRDILGKDCAFLHHRDGNCSSAMALQNAFAAHEPHTSLLRHLRRNGEMFDCLLFVMPVRNVKGEALYFVVTLQNVSGVRSDADRFAQAQRDITIQGRAIAAALRRCMYLPMASTGITAGDARSSRSRNRLPSVFTGIASSTSIVMDVQP